MSLWKSVAASFPLQRTVRIGQVDATPVRLVQRFLRESNTMCERLECEEGHWLEVCGRVSADVSNTPPEYFTVEYTLSMVCLHGEMYEEDLDPAEFRTEYRQVFTDDGKTRRVTYPHHPGLEIVYQRL